MIKKLSVYGIGNFGYAWLKHFDNQDNLPFSVHAYDREEQVVQHLQQHRKHPFLHQNTQLSKKIIFENSVEDLLNDCDLLLLAVTSDATREVIEQIKPFIQQHKQKDKRLIIVNTAKALDYKTGHRLSTIIAETLGGHTAYTYALLAGGTIASDLFAHEPLGIDIATQEETILPELVSIFSSPNLRVYPTTDLIGVEYASAFKSVIAILAGMIKGMGFSYGSETHIISRAAGEIEDIVINQLGGKKETFAMDSQCWGNDLWMSCTGPTRNREFGILLGQGMSVDDATAQMAAEHKSVEGIKTIQALEHINNIEQYALLSFLPDYVIKHNSSLAELKKVIFTHQF